MKKIDVVIILGGGVDGTIKPVKYTAERLKGFLKYKKLFKNSPIVVSGGHSVWIKKPTYSEAEVMKHYLLAKGFNCVFKEEKSRDTVGSVYFSKQVVKRYPAWKNLLIVTSKGHRTRSEWLFKKIFGSGYRFNYLEIPSKIGNFGTKKRADYEKFVIGIYKRLVGKFRTGDDKAIFRILKRKHPAFSKSKEAKRIAEEINTGKKKYLGYVNPNAR